MIEFNSCADLIFDPNQKQYQLDVDFKGQLYVGELNDGQYHGRGTLRYDESTYVGTWQNGKPWEGARTFIFKDGGEYVGTWRGGKPLKGAGNFISRMEGTRENDGKQGMFTVTLANEDSYKQKYKDDHPANSKRWLVEIDVITEKVKILKTLETNENKKLEALLQNLADERKQDENPKTNSLKDVEKTDALKEVAKWFLQSERGWFVHLFQPGPSVQEGQNQDQAEGSSGGFRSGVEKQNDIKEENITKKDGIKKNINFIMTYQNMMKLKKKLLADVESVPWWENLIQEGLFRNWIISEKSGLKAQLETFGKELASKTTQEKLKEWHASATDE